MIGLSVALAALLFIFIILKSSRFFYSMEIKLVTRRLTRLHGLNIQELDYSFEQIVYFISLPSNIPIIKNAKLEDVMIKLDYKSQFFPRLSGIKIVVHSKTEKLTLAYLPIKDFRIPALDQIVEQGIMDEADYLNMNTCKLIHPKTLEEISDEVYKQMQMGRNGK